MIDRKKEVKKSSLKSVISSLTVIIIILGIASYGMYFEIYPKEINLGEAKEGNYYTFTVIKVANIEVDDENSDYYYVSIMNKDKDVAEAYVKKAQKDELISANKNNPVRFVGIASLMDKTIDGRDEYIDYLKEVHFANMNKYYDIMLFEPEDSKPEIPYLLIAFVLIVFARYSYEIYKSLKARKNALVFYDNNPLYNEYESKLSLHKNLSVVRDYLISTKSPAVQLNISDCAKVTLIRHRTYLITTHINLSYIDNEGKTGTVTLPRLSKQKSQELINYFDSLGKYKTL